METEEIWKHITGLFKTQPERVKLILDTLYIYVEKDDLFDNLPSYIRFTLSSYEKNKYQIFSDVFIKLFKKHPKDYNKYFVDYLMPFKYCLEDNDFDIIFDVFDMIYKFAEYAYCFNNSVIGCSEISHKRIMNDIKVSKDVLDAIIYFKMKLRIIWEQ